MKARAKLEQGGNLAVGTNTAARGLQRPYQKFQQCRFTRAVVPYNADALPVGNSERDITQHMVKLVLWAPQNNLGQAILRSLIDLKIFIDVLDDNSRGSMYHA